MGVTFVIFMVVFWPNSIASLEIFESFSFEPSSFDAIIFESTLLNENSEKIINKILKNAYIYLKGNGIMMCPIYEEKTLTPRPRYYTTNYIDNIYDGQKRNITKLMGASSSGWHYQSL